MVQPAVQGTPLWITLRRQQKTDPNDLLRRFGITVAPVNVEAIAASLGVHLWYRADLEWSGVCETTYDRADMWINTRDTMERQRFTIAHELGHILKHPLGSLFRDARETGNAPREREANAFAANLLVPLSLLRYAAQVEPDERALARWFQVSPKVMEIRLGLLEAFAR